jgi:hypothetical protein
MKRAWLALVTLLLISPAIVAQDGKPAKPAVELMTLYTKAGRSWTYRVIHSIRGESPDVETATTRITALEDGLAHCVTESESADRSRFSTSRFTVNPADVPEEWKAWGDSELPEETLDTGFRKLPCKKHQVKTKTAQTTTWISVEYHPLIVKQVTITGDSTSIRKLTAFNSGDVDPWQLYRKEGRRWKTKMTLKMGGNAMVSYTEYEIKQANEDAATLTMSSLDSAGKVTFTQDSEIKFKAAEAGAVAASDTQLTMETKTCAVGEFECHKSDMNGTKTWTSIHWPGLLVAMSGNGLEMELVEFDLGHDQHAFYRTAGNFYVTKSTTRVQGIQIESSTRIEVKSVKELEVVWVVVVYDKDKKEIMRQESTLTLPENAEATSYAGEFEELVDTPAGRLPAIRTDTSVGDESALVNWTWNGIVVRSEQRMGVAETTVELVELNWQ